MRCGGPGGASSRQQAPSVPPLSLPPTLHTARLLRCPGGLDAGLLHRSRSDDARCKAARRGCYSRLLQRCCLRHSLRGAGGRGPLPKGRQAAQTQQHSRRCGWGSVAACCARGAGAVRCSHRGCATPAATGAGCNVSRCRLMAKLVMCTPVAAVSCGGEQRRRHWRHLCQPDCECSAQSDQRTLPNVAGARPLAQRPVRVALS